MNSEMAKTVGTSAVWVSVAMILAFGLFRMNGPDWFFVLTTLIIMIGATVSTVAIWSPPAFRGDKAKPEPRGFDVIPPAQSNG